MKTKQPIFLGNWKMNMLPEEVIRFAESFLEQFTASQDFADTGFAAPFTSLPSLQEVFFDAAGIRLGAQNAHWEDSGAYTGEISAPMLRYWGVDFVICGHSERRQFFGETDQAVAKRAKAVISSKMTAVVCVGETKEQFEAKETEAVVSQQLRASLEGIGPADLDNLIIAYEPVWAIGTGLAATAEIAGSVHAKIRAELSQLYPADKAAGVSILYGGSAKPDNVAELLAEQDINGCLVGGASLIPDAFAALIENGRNAKA